MQRALVTGSKGYSGKLLVKTLNDMGWVVTEYDHKPNYCHDINSTALEKLFAEVPFCVVFHLAAVSNVRECEKDLQRTYATNSLSTIRLHQLCQKYNSKLIFVSSVAVLGKEKTAYSLSKEVAEFHLKDSKHAVIVRLPNVIGAYEGFSFRKQGSLFDELMLAMRDNHQLTIYGNARREYVDVQTVVRNLIAAVNVKVGSVVKVQGSMRCSIIELIMTIQKLTKHQFDIIKLPATDPQNYTIDEERFVNEEFLAKVIKTYE